MSTEREELLEKANELGIDFHSNVKTDKLREMIAESEGPATKPDEPPEETELEAAPEVEKAKSTIGANVGEISPLRQRIADAKKRATELHVVTITNKDSRENEIMTTAPLSFENQHFGLSRNVPLDIPVELEQGLITVAESIMMPLHKDEIVNGRRTGNKVTVQVKKYAVSYAKS